MSSKSAGRSSLAGLSDGTRRVGRYGEVRLHATIDVSTCGDGNKMKWWGMLAMRGYSQRLGLFGRVLRWWD